ncbi:MAG: hypothetical protein ACLP72_11290 [Candidatus Sulfotelmatobacter sp.]
MIVIKHRELLRSVLRLLLLVLLFSASAVYEATHVSALSTSDVWVHLRTGTWILQNHAVPRTGLFSQYPNLPWNDSSWGYEVLLAAAYRVLGLRALPILLMGFKVALAVVTFLLARTGRASFWAAIFLSAVAQYVIPGLQPLPYAFSILFFAIEWQLLVRSRQTGGAKNLFWLPVLFVFWANLHIQFVAGLLLLGLFVIALLLEKMLRALRVNWLSERVRPLDLKQVGIASVLSVLGTLANPYTVHLLPAAFKVLYSPVGFEHFTQMSAMSFRRPQEFALMLLVMAAFLALGRRRSLDLFELMTLVAGTLVAFRIERDGWLAVLPAIAVLSGGLQFAQTESESPRNGRLPWERRWAAALTVAVLVLASLCVPGSNALLNKISSVFPVKACDYILANRLPQPLFNAYSWGGFLTWYMPQYPVVIDSRIELYGDGILGSYFNVVSGKELLESDPMVARAGTLLLERQSAMAKALTNLPALSARYRLAYSDDLASVFVPKPAP